MNNIKIIALFITLIGAYTCSTQGMHSFNDGLKTRRASPASTATNGKEKYNPTKLAAFRLRFQKGSLKQEDIFFNYLALQQELKERNAAKNSAKAPVPSTSAHLTQTEAHLKIYKDQISLCLKRNPSIASALARLIEQEKLYDRTHYVFYHTQIIRLSVMQDFLKEFYQFGINGKT